MTFSETFLRFKVFLQGHGIVDTLFFGAVEKCDGGPAHVGQKLPDRFRVLIQFRKVPRFELAPFGRIVTIPLPQLV